MDDIGWGKWIDDKVNSLMSVVTAAKDAKASETNIKAESQNVLAKYKKEGFKLNLDDVIYETQGFKNAREIMGVWKGNPELKKAGYSVTWLQALKAYEPETYARLKKGDLSAIGIKTATQTSGKKSLDGKSAGYDESFYSKSKTKTNGNQSTDPGVVWNEVNSDIYLDTGKLVGGTQNAYSKANSQQYNYTARGLAT